MKKKPTLLLVDDSSFSQSQMMRALGKEYDYITANDGAEGLIKLEKNEVDLIITDLLMPNISGLAFLGQVRKNYKGTKVIVCSADIQEATINRAKTLGAAAFLSKPVNKDEVKRIVRLLLKHDQAPREMSINPKYTDAFREIFNIGVGKAANSLSQLIYDTVKLSVPKLAIIHPDQLSFVIAENFNEEVACVKQNLQGAADGSAFLLLSAKGGMNLINALVKNDETEEMNMTIADQDMLKEVGNILINSLVGTLGNTLGIDFDIGQPSCYVVPSYDVSQHLGMEDTDYVMYVETLFVVPGRQVGGSLVILLTTGGMKAIFKGMDSVL